MTGGQPQRRSREESQQAAADTERELLIAATSRAIAEHGATGLVVEQIVRYAGLSDVTFYEHFTGTEQALVGANHAFFDRLWEEVADACDSVEDWPMRVRAAVDAALSYLAEVSSLARVLAIEAAAVSLATRERQLAALERFAALLRDGRRHYPAAASLPDATERGLVGGVASIVSAHLLMEDPQAISAMIGQLVEFLLIPYIGREQARRIAAA